MIERSVLADAPGDADDWAALKVSETFLRDLIAESLGLQRLDVLVGRVLRALMDRRDDRERAAVAPAPCDLDSSIVPLGGGEEPAAGIISLGNKGFMLARLLGLGFHVPSGFALTTELVRDPEGLARPEGPHPRVVSGIRAQIARLERLTGRRLGDTSNPLLLSVRGGAPVSMPGMLETFLNVGINEEIAEGMTATPRYAWAAWDSYRRFLQFWGMSHGLDRQHFDELMREGSSPGR
jgi:pyruvate,orthophosphate dikinase